MIFIVSHVLKMEDKIKYIHTVLIFDLITVLILDLRTVLDFRDYSGDPNFILVKLINNCYGIFTCIARCR
jgi:hypothetical protein